MNFNNLHLLDIRFFFEGIKGYMDFMEEYIEQSINEFDEKYEIEKIEKYKISNEEYYYHLSDTASEKWHEVATYYPHNFRASFLAQAYSDVESKLRSICDHYYRVKKTSDSLESIKANNDIEKSIKFLKTQAGVDFKNLKNDLSYLNLIRKIRNRIIHHQSKINASHNDWLEIKKFILENPNMISFKEDLDEKDEDGEPYYRSKPKYGFSFIINSRLLNDRFLEVAERFFKQLLDNELKYK